MQTRRKEPLKSNYLSLTALIYTCLLKAVLNLCYCYTCSLTLKEKRIKMATNFVNAIMQNDNIHDEFGTEQLVIPAGEYEGVVSKIAFRTWSDPNKPDTVVFYMDVHVTITLSDELQNELGETVVTVKYTMQVKINEQSGLLLRKPHNYRIGQLAAACGIGSTADKFCEPFSTDEEVLRQRGAEFTDVFSGCTLHVVTKVETRDDTLYAKVTKVRSTS